MAPRYMKMNRSSGCTNTPPGTAIRMPPIWPLTWEMRCKVRKPRRHFLAWFIVIAALSTASLQAQEQKSQKRFFLGAGIGLCDVAFRQLGKTVDEFGPSFSGFLDIHLSQRASLQLEYSVLHPNDEEPRISDILVTIPENSQDGYAIFTFVRYPRIFRTRVLLLSYQRLIARNLYVRAGLGVGGNDFARYRETKDAVVEAGVSTEGGYALGLAAGYQRSLSNRFKLTLEVTVRISTGEDSTSAAWVFGLGTALTWDF